MKPVKSQKSRFANYLDGLPEWDKTPRLDGLFIDYLGAGNNLFNKKLAELFGVAAVARAQCPGINWWRAPVLVGPKSVDITQFLKSLFYWRNVVQMTKAMAHNGEGLTEIIGKACIEISAETYGMSHHMGKGAKAFIARNRDKLRIKYQNRVKDYPRESVYAITTDNADYFKEECESKRFWVVPVRVKEIDFDALAHERDQIWAEAKHLWELAVIAAGDKCAIDLDAMAANLPENLDSVSLPELTDLRAK